MLSYGLSSEMLQFMNERRCVVMSVYSRNPFTRSVTFTLTGYGDEPDFTLCVISPHVVGASGKPVPVTAKELRDTLTGETVKTFSLHSERRLSRGTSRQASIIIFTNGIKVISLVTEGGLVS